MPPLASPITVTDIKARLVGLESWLRVAAQSSSRYDDSSIEALIGPTVRRFERETQFRINPIQIVTRGDRDGTYAADGEQYDATGTYEVVEADPYSYYHEDSLEYFKFTLRERPVRSVQRCRITLGPGTTYWQLPSDWFRFESKTGRFWLLPYTATAAFYGGAVGFAIMQTGLSNRSSIPMIVHFDYIAGLPDNWGTLNEWSDLLRCLQECCALQVLNDIAELYDAGLLSAGIQGEGFGQSSEYSRFVQRKQELMQSVGRFQATLRDQETPISMVVV